MVRVCYITNDGQLAMHACSVSIAHSLIMCVFVRFEICDYAINYGMVIIHSVIQHAICDAYLMLSDAKLSYLKEEKQRKNTRQFDCHFDNTKKETPLLITIK